LDSTVSCIFSSMSELVESFSGIRGIYNKSLTCEIAQKYAQAFLRLLDTKQFSNKPILLARDTRASSGILAQAFKGIFICEGRGVIDLGVASIPASQHSVRHFKAAGGVYITASHNPPEYNGWKFLDASGAVLRPSDAKQVIKFAQGPIPESKDGETGITYDKSEESVGAYIDFLASIVGDSGIKSIKEKKFTIIFDAGGGSAIKYIQPFAEKFGIKAVGVNCQEGEFNRPIEPTVENLTHLKSALKSSGADFALGFDADGDRAEMVLPDGEMVSGQYLVAMVVDSVLSSIKDARSQTVVFNDASSDLLSAVAKKHGARVLEVETGETNIVRAMKDLQSMVGGEGSTGGGIVSPQTCRDALLSSIIIVRHLTKTGKTVKQLIDSYPKFYTVFAKVSINPDFQIRSKIENFFAGNKSVKISKTGDEAGGIKIRHSGGAWLWLRQSKTEPSVMRVYADSKDEARAKELLEIGVKLVKGL